MLCEAVAYIVYIRDMYFFLRERYSFSLVCTFTKAIKNFEVNVNVQKFRENLIL